MPITDFIFKKYTHSVHADLNSPQPNNYPVIIAGAGPSGLTLALELARQQIPSIIIERDETVSYGSRAICYSQRSLDILNRLGGGKKLARQGVGWNRGRVYFKEELAYQYRLLSSSSYQMPAFINLQQYYLEDVLLKECQKYPCITIRWQEAIVDCKQNKNKVMVTIDTPDGSYQLSCNHLIAADGASSTIREILGLSMKGQSFADNFLICDIKISDRQTQFSNQRCYWFNPPFHTQGSVLLHRQPDNVYRIDFQLGDRADPVYENKIENISKRLCSMLGHSDWSLEWSSVYRFRCRRLDSFIHGNVIFLGDSAHQVSPFGARGANGAIASAENLGWKLGSFLQGRAGKKILQTYNHERGIAADENINQSTMSAIFISPPSRATKKMRDKILHLSQHAPNSRPLINSGRLSTAAHYPSATLVEDAPLTKKNTWLLEQLGGSFTLMCIAPTPQLKTKIIHYTATHTGCTSLFLSKKDRVAIERLNISPGEVLLVRPDQYIISRQTGFKRTQTNDSIRRALCLAKKR